LRRVILPYGGGPLTLSWTISNGPVSYVFDQQSGGCTYGSNSNGGLCLTTSYTKNIPPSTSLPLNYTLYVSNNYGISKCATNITKICVIRSNEILVHYQGLLDGPYCFQSPCGNRLVTERTYYVGCVRPGNNFYIYFAYWNGSSYYCATTPSFVLTFEDAVCLDVSEDSQVYFGYYGGWRFFDIYNGTYYF
jgi:hypothetical protein